MERDAGGADATKVHVEARRPRDQTLDNGAAVAPYTVGQELGHGGDTLVKRVYGHLGQVRHHSKVVEYRVAQHRKILGDRLAALAGVTL